MNVLDENILRDQRQLLVESRIHVRQVGFEVGRAGMHDDEIIPLLHGLSRPTFFTRDRDFFKPGLRHPAYCLVLLHVRRDETAAYVRRLLRHPLFDSSEKRLGHVLLVSPTGIRAWRSYADAAASLNWPR